MGRLQEPNGRLDGPMAVFGAPGKVGQINVEVFDPLERPGRGHQAFQEHPAARAD